MRKTQNKHMIEERASLREVYEIARRIEDKIDAQSQNVDRRFSNIEQRVANMEGRATIISIGWSTLVSFISIILETLYIRK